MCCWYTIDFAHGALLFRSVLLVHSIDFAHGALRSSGLGRVSIYRPWRPYTAPPPPPPPLLLLLLLSQCCAIEMIHRPSCCRARSSSRAVRARVRVVISGRRIIHDTKWEQSVPWRRPAAARYPPTARWNNPTPLVRASLHLHFSSLCASAVVVLCRL